MPKVSIIIPSYNHEKFIKEAIQSVLDQTFQDFEIVIVDDGSRDNTVKVIKGFKDKRIKLFEFEENFGAVYATNYAIEKSKGQYISLLNSDDAYFPRKLEEQVAFLDQNQDVSAVFAFAQAIDNNSKEVKPNPEYFEPREINRGPRDWLRTFYCKGNWIIHPTILIRKQVFITYGKYDERLAQVPDFLYWVKLSFRNNRIHILPQKLVKYRFHVNNASSSKKQGVSDRLMHEYQFILEQYLDNINDLELLNYIFPEISNSIYYCHDTDVIKFLSALAIYTTPVRGDAIDSLKKHIALQRLFKLFEDQSYAKKIQQKCNFYYPELIKLSGRHHLFVNDIDKENFEVLKRIENSLTWRFLSKIRQKFLDRLVPNRNIFANSPNLKRIIKIRKRKRIKLTDRMSKNYQKLLTILYNPKLNKYKEELPENIALVEAVKLTTNHNSKYYLHSNRIPELSSLTVESSLFILETYNYDTVFHLNLGAEFEPEHKGGYDIQKIISAIQNSLSYTVVINKDKFAAEFDKLLNPQKTNFIPLFLLGFAVKNKLRIKLVDLTSKRSIEMDYNGSHPLQIGTYKISANEHKAFNLTNLIEYYIDNTEDTHRDKASEYGVLFALPFILDAGENHLVRKIVKNFSRLDYKSTLITTLNIEPDYLGFGDGNPEYRKVTKDIHHLYKLFDQKYWADYIDYLIKTRHIKIIYIISCTYIYKLLPEIKRKFPYIKIVDELFNEVGYLENNRNFSKQIDLTIVENHNLEKLLIDKYKEQQSKVRLIESGIDTKELFNPKNYQKDVNQKKFNLSSEDLNILFLGRLSPEKSPLKFIEIANRFKNKNDIQFLLAGDGEQKTQVINKIGELGLQRKIRLLGMVNSTEILSAVDLLILPSDYDGRPLAVLEALSMGVPVIVSNVGGLPDVIQEGENGFLVDPMNINGFVERIEELYEDQELLGNLSRTARKTATTNFSEEKMYRGYTKAIETLLAKK